MQFNLYHILYNLIPKQLWNLCIPELLNPANFCSLMINKKLSIMSIPFHLSVFPTILFTDMSYQLTMFLGVHVSRILPSKPTVKPSTLFEPVGPLTTYNILSTNIITKSTPCQLKIQYWGANPECNMRYRCKKESEELNVNESVEDN